MLAGLPFRGTITAPARNGKPADSTFQDQAA